jgi:hypothetical protein
VLALFNVLFDWAKVLFDWAKVLFDKTDADDNGEVVPFDLIAICCCDGCDVVVG